MTEIKLGLIVIGGIVVVTVITAGVVCAAKPDAAKDIITVACGVAGTAVSGITGWMGRGIYDAAKKALTPEAPAPADLK